MIKSIGSIIKAVSISGVFVAAISVFYYVSGLRADLERSQANIDALKDSVSEQSEVITRMRKQQAEIRKINNDLEKISNTQSQEIEELRSRFDTSADGSDRDFAGLAAEKPGLVENGINDGTDDAFRCIELASGADRTEEEINATKPSQINSLCPSIANPNYTPDK